MRQVERPDLPLHVRSGPYENHHADILLLFEFKPCFN